MPPPTRPACHRNGGPLRVGTVARFTSEWRPTLRWNAGPLRVGLPGPLPLEFAVFRPFLFATAFCDIRPLNGDDWCSALRQGIIFDQS